MLGAAELYRRIKDLDLGYSVNNSDSGGAEDLTLPRAMSTLRFCGRTQQGRSIVDITPRANRSAESGWGVRVLGGREWQEEMGRRMLPDSLRGVRAPMVS